MGIITKGVSGVGIITKGLSGVDIITKGVGGVGIRPITEGVGGVGPSKFSSSITDKIINEIMESTNKFTQASQAESVNDV